MASNLIEQLRELDDVIQLLIDFIESEDLNNLRAKRAAGKAEAPPTPKAAAPDTSPAPDAPPAPEAMPESPPEKTYAFEEVRQLLGTKVQEGYRAEVKAIIAELGGQALSDLKDDPAKLADAVARAEALGRESTGKGVSGNG